MVISDINGDTNKFIDFLKNAVTYFQNPNCTQKHNRFPKNALIYHITYTATLYSASRYVDFCCKDKWCYCQGAKVSNTEVSLNGDER